MLLSNRWETESIIHNRKHEFGLMFLPHHNPFKSTVPTAEHCLPHREQNTQQKHNTALPVQGTKQASTKSAWPTDSESVLTSGFYHPCVPLSVCVCVWWWEEKWWIRTWDTMTWQLNKCSSDLIPRQKKIDFHLTTRNLHASHCGRRRNTSLSISALQTHTLLHTHTNTHQPCNIPWGGTSGGYTGDTWV